MSGNRRRDEPAIPENFQALLTPAQQESLESLTYFGWRIYLVRRPKFKPIEVIVTDNKGKYALVTEEGDLDQTQLPIRQDAASLDTTGEHQDGPGTGRPDIATSVQNEPVPTPRSRPGNRPPKKIIV